MEQYEIYWSDLSENAKNRLKNLYHDNIELNPLAIICIEDIETSTHKMVALNVEEYRGNANELLERFRLIATSEGWNQTEINSVITEATKHDDYNHLVETIREYCKY